MKRKMTGFTLIELLAVLVIAGILFMMSGPSIRGIFTSNRMATHLNQLSTAINFARSEAIKRGAAVAIGQSGTWALGWDVWTDNGAKPGEYDAASEALLRKGDSTSAATITLVGNTTTVVYQPDGSIMVPDASNNLIVPVGDTTFTLCYTGQMPRILTLSITGKPEVSTGSTACP